MSLPSNVKTFAELAPHSLCAAAAIVSNTGCTSVCDWLITRRISLVAVCCSSASVRSRLRSPSSVNSRTFSIAITAWSAKALSNSTCLSENGSTLVRKRSITPTATLYRSRGTASIVRWPYRRCSSRPIGYSSSLSAARS